AACGAKFADEFAPKVFRRPLTAIERAAVVKIFDAKYSGGDIKVAQSLGIQALLTAPGFLYRSELGEPVMRHAADGNQYVAGTPVETTAGPNFSGKVYGEAQTDGSWMIRMRDGQTPYIEQHMKFYPAGTLIQVTLRGQAAGDVTPKLELRTGGTTQITEDINFSEYRTLKYYVSKLDNTQALRFELKNGGAVAGVDRVVYIKSVSVSPATLMPGAADKDAYKLTPYELASFLSYTYTGSTPDDTLLAAAKAGLLETDAQINAQIARLLATPRAQQQLGDFVAQWLRTDEVLTVTKDPAKYPELTAPIRAAMAQEVRNLFTQVVLGQGENYSHFFAADFTYANADLAKYYGLSGATGSALIKVPAGSQRGGILTTGAFLAVNGDPDESSPIRRAVRIRERLLCQDIDPPPPGISVSREAAEKALKERWESGQMTNRERYAALTAAPY
ncbi:MAG TPA: DUF1592 domain-containing protein, partial [Cellvibrionaceae bacterium]|nr:DUF1592 domain-containing protein [Cellvibrionaceae bacterium]